MENTDTGVKRIDIRNDEHDRGPCGGGLIISIDSIPQQAWAADGSGKITEVNQVICQDFNLTREAIIERSWTAFVHPDDLGMCLERWQKSLATGEEYTSEFRLLFADGEYRWHLAKAIKTKDHNNIVFWLGINTNIEVQKKTNPSKMNFFH